ncbi:hypothetical protein BC834DRAFT_612116 [Gloeopeniophorella convolvens]|nr:hypothetical protein BC834DRAFT_612116 [Gloeopeniophorella convolvens]
MLTCALVVSLHGECDTSPSLAAAPCKPNAHSMRPASTTPAALAPKHPRARTRPADPVDVALDRQREPAVQHTAHVRDAQLTRRHVRRDQRPRAPIVEALQRVQPCRPRTQRAAPCP